jgi:hypothetical protein
MIIRVKDSNGIPVKEADINSIYFPKIMKHKENNNVVIFTSLYKGVIINSHENILMYSEDLKIDDYKYYDKVISIRINRYPINENIIYPYIYIGTDNKKILALDEEHSIYIDTYYNNRLYQYKHIGYSYVSTNFLKLTMPPEFKKIYRKKIYLQNYPSTVLPINMCLYKDN